MKIRKRTNVGRSTRLSACTRKVPRSRAGAERAVERRIAAGAYPASITCYPCKHCGFWHVGTVRPDEMRYRRRR